MYNQLPLIFFSCFVLSRTKKASDDFTFSFKATRKNCHHSNYIEMKLDFSQWIGERTKEFNEFSGGTNSAIDIQLKGRRNRYL